MLVNNKLIPISLTTDFFMLNVFVEIHLEQRKNNWKQ